MLTSEQKFSLIKKLREYLGPLEFKRYDKETDASMCKKILEVLERDLLIDPNIVRNISLDRKILFKFIGFPYIRDGYFFHPRDARIRLKYLGDIENEMLKKLVY